MKKVKLTAEFVDVLRSFSRINNGIYIPKNSGVITTMTPTKTMLAEYKTDIRFPVNVVIFDLQKFIMSISGYSIDDFELEFTEKYLTVVANNQKTRMFFSDLELITYPEKTVKLPNCSVEFDLSADMLDTIIKKARMLDVSDVRISNYSNGEKRFVLQVLDHRNETSSSFEIDLGQTTEARPFEFFFNVDSLKVHSTDYHVRLSDRIISEFSATQMKLTYWIAMNTNSKAPSDERAASTDTENEDENDVMPEEE